MNRVTILGVTLALVMIPGLAGCGSDKPKADKSSPTKSATPTPTPTSTPTPTVRSQPKGKYGVTFRIANWRAFSTNPAVATYKAAAEAIWGSANSKRIVPGYTARLTKPLQRKLLPTVRQGWLNGWHTPKVAKVRIVSAKGGSVVACEWEPSISFYKANGQPVSKPPKKWDRNVYTMKKVGQVWRLAALKAAGSCKGGAPR